ncbi:MAG: lytic transglycosylase domain-containing protein [Deltaproteobacteria bacterium]|nr:lytic transglycosylase domain-containing protein [Deltaproteobacteria bacterium]
MLSRGTTLEDIGRDYREGRFGAAVLQLFYYIENDPRPDDVGEAEFLMGLALLRQERPAEAAFYFRAAEEDLPAVADAAAARRVRALEKAARYDEAVTALDAARRRYPSSPLFFEAGAWEARLTGRGGHHARSAAMYEDLAGANGAAAVYTEYRYLAGEAWERAGRRDAALAAHQSVIDARRIDRFTTRALKRYAALWRAEHPGDASAGESAAMIAFADARFNADQYRQAQAAYEAYLDISGKTMDAEHRYRLGLAAFYNHDNARALASLEPIARATGTARAEAATYRVAKVHTRLGDNAASRKTFEDLLRRFPSGGYRRATVYQLALLDMEDNDYAKAYAYFDRRLKTPSGGQKEYLTWLKGWTAFRAGKLTTAETVLSEMLAEFKKSRDRDRYQFWRGAMRFEKKRVDDAAADWRAVNAAPRTYYGMLAADRLREVGRPARDAAADLTRPDGEQGLPPLTPDLFPPEHRRLAERILLLARLGCHDLASRLTAFVPEITDDDPIERRLLAMRLVHQGARYHQAIRWTGDRNNKFYQYARETGRHPSETYWSYLYPLGYADEIHRQAARRGVAESLVYAVIFNESRFSPNAVSPANAIGLMQIVPRTAREIADAIGETDFQEDDLYDPETNIRFGVYYLASMLARFHGAETCAIASYNAGPDVVGKWWRNKGDLPVEYFVEEIPYRETNNYVKKVRTTQKIYEILHGLTPTPGGGAVDEKSPGKLDC